MIGVKMSEMMKEKDVKKLKFEVTLSWDPEKGGKAQIGTFPPMEFDTPLEFGGESRYPCPDEIFFSAVGGCLITTFLYFKKRLKLDLRGIQVTVQGTVAPVGPKGYRIKGIEAFVNVEADEKERSKAEKCAKLAIEYCHITRSLEDGIPVEADYQIRIPDRT